MIHIAVFSDELVLNLQQAPKKLREAIKEKFQAVVEQVQGDLHQGVPGKYVDSETITSGFSEIGSTVIGFIEARDKDGLYPITPKVAPFLKFEVEDGRIVRTKLALHPYPKGTVVVEQILRDTKPWLEEQLSEIQENWNG